jgi:broad specificity phosphatase PhoE
MHDVDRTLVVVRHGQTDWNLEERFQGQLDIPLNAVGRGQAETLKRQLGNIRFDAAYSSPLRRAYETAEIIAAGLPVQADARLAEIHHGAWQGKTKQDIADLWPDEWAEWNELPTQFTPPGAEPAGSVRSRVEDFLQKLEGTLILCVSHGIIIQTLLSVLLGPSHEEYVPANGSIHTFVFRNNRVCDYHIEC